MAKTMAKMIISAQEDKPSTNQARDERAQHRNKRRSGVIL
jgi:hypothetical protein